MDLRGHLDLLLLNTLHDLGAAGVCVALAAALFGLPASVRRAINVDTGSMPGLYYTVLAGTMVAVAAVGCVIWAVAVRRSPHPMLASAVE